VRSTTLAITQTRIREYQYFCVTCPKPGGGRRRRFFRDKREARTYFELCQVQQKNHGIAAFSVSESLRIEALECSEKLETVGSTLRQATSFFLDHFHRTNRSCTVNAAIAELCKARQIDGCSKRYLDDLRVRLARFSTEFGERILTAITAGEIDDWLRDLPVGGVTRNTFRRRLSILFGYAKKRGYVPVNPVVDVERANERPEPIGILSVDETRRLLKNAQPQMLAFWTIGAFAGLRTVDHPRYRDCADR
jgi:hypothetical protein